MKVKPAHYQEILEIVKEAKSLCDTSKTLSNNMRNRWDCLWSSPRATAITASIYNYANDDHIDTALKTAFKAIFGA